jgi:hypothetical protein
MSFFIDFSAYSIFNEQDYLLPLFTLVAAFSPDG